jgi:uncharacterized protein YndB with AHSA1/START domain
MKQIQASTIIHQPVKNVFEFMWNPQTIRLWLPEPNESIPLATETEQPIVCSRNKVRGWAGITLEYIQETKEHIPNRKFYTQLREIHGWIISQSHWDYETVAAGTQITVQHDVELRSWLRLASPIIFLVAQKKVESDLIRLKKILEKS